MHSIPVAIPLLVHFRWLSESALMSVNTQIRIPPKVLKLLHELDNKQAELSTNSISLF